MANPTTNFGWVMPTSTDLVTDLPADFAVFGQGVDTTMAGLKGGTTGQVLSKTSATDMAFTWTAAGMTNPMTTTGDTIYSSSGSTPARLAIGSTGQVLTVSGGVPTWAAASLGKVKQIVSATTTTATSTNSTTYADLTGQTVSITPTSATSKVLIMWATNAYGSVSGYDDAVGTMYFQALRGATSLATDQRVLSSSSSATGGNGRDLIDVVSWIYVDSPATTSSTTYKFQGKRATLGGTQAASWGYGSYQSTIIAMEIEA